MSLKDDESESENKVFLIDDNPYIKIGDQEEENAQNAYISSKEIYPEILASEMEFKKDQEELVVHDDTVSNILNKELDTHPKPLDNLAETSEKKSLNNVEDLKTESNLISQESSTIIAEPVIRAIEKNSSDSGSSSNNETSEISEIETNNFPTLTIENDSETKQNDNFDPFPITNISEIESNNMKKESPTLDMQVDNIIELKEITNTENSGKTETSIEIAESVTGVIDSPPKNETSKVKSENSDQSELIETNHIENLSIADTLIKSNDIEPRHNDNFDRFLLKDISEIKSENIKKVDQILDKQVDDSGAEIDLTENNKVENCDVTNASIITVESGPSKIVTFPEIETLEVKSSIATSDTKEQSNEEETDFKEIDEEKISIIEESVFDDPSLVENLSTTNGQKENSNVIHDSIENEKQIEDIEEKYDLVKIFENEQSIAKNMNYFKIANKLEFLKISDASNTPIEEASENNSESEKSSIIENENFSFSIKEIDNTQEHKDKPLNEVLVANTKKHESTDELAFQNAQDVDMLSNIKEECDFKESENAISLDYDQEIKLTNFKHTEFEEKDGQDEFVNDSTINKLEHKDITGTEESSRAYEIFPHQNESFESFLKDQAFSYKENDFIQHETMNIEPTLKYIDENEFCLENPMAKNSEGASRFLDTINENEIDKKIQNKPNFMTEERNQSELSNELLENSLEKSFTKYEIDEEKLLNYEHENLQNEAENYKMNLNQRSSNSIDEFCLIESSIVEPIINSSHKIKTYVTPTVSKLKKQGSLTSPSFSNDSLSANSKSGETGILKSTDKKNNKFYQPKSLNEVKKVKILSNFEISKESAPKKTFYKPNIMKMNDTKDSNPILKSSNSFYLVKNKPILVPPTLSEVKNRLKNDLPRRVQNDLRLYQRSKNSNLASKSIDTRVGAENKINEKIRVYRTKRWTSESPVKNYINSGKVIPIKKTPIEEINYYNRISLIKNKMNQLNRESSRPTRIDDFQNNQTDRTNPLLNNLLQGSYISGSQNSESFLFNRRTRPLSRDQHQELDSRSFEFLKNFFYLNERYREEKYFESPDSNQLKEGSILKNYPSYPFKRNESFYTLFRSKLNEFYSKRIKWILKIFYRDNFKNKQLNSTFNEPKLMITDYEDLFRNMKEVDFENKIKYHHIQPTRRKINFKDQNISSDLNPNSIKKANNYKEKLHKFFVTTMIVVLLALLYLNISILTDYLKKN